MKFYAWLLILLSFVLSGLAWPPPPEKARIEYLYSFRTPEDLKIPKKTSARVFDFIFGKGKTDVDVLVRPQGIFAENERMLVTDTFLGCVHVFDQKEKKYFKIKKAGKDALLSPVGIVSDAHGTIYVSDSILKKILMFTAKGDFIGELGKGRFLRPTGLAIDNISSRIYIIDTLDNSISVFSLDGAFLLKFGAPGAKAGSFNYPTYAAVGKNGDVYVVDSLNFRVQIFSKEGKFKTTFGKMGRAPGSFAMPKGIAIDSEQNIYISDASFDNVQIFDGTGNLLLFFGESGNGAGEFWLPAGIYIDVDDKIYAADSYNSRVMVFKLLK